MSPKLRSKSTNKVAKNRRKDMPELIYKEIDPKDEKRVKDLINVVLDGLERPEFFISYSEWELENLFNKDYAPLYGAYDSNKLVGMGQLYVNQDSLKEYKETFNITDKKVAELGGALVLPEYRRRGIMTTLMNMITDLAKDMGFDYAISMAHPDNIGSSKALKNVGLEYVKTVTENNGYLRDFFIMELK